MLQARFSFQTLRALPHGDSKYMVKIPIPRKGEFWFTFEESLPMELVTEKISEEAPDLLVDTDFSSRSLKEAMDANFYQLSINNTYFHIENKNNIDPHKSGFGLYVDSLIKSQPRSIEEMHKYANHLLNVVGKEHEIIMKHLNQQLQEVEKELACLEDKKYQLLEADIKKSLVKQYTKLGLLFFQWGFFYYTIFHIPYLGWDIMEPMTYSIGQGSFVYRLFKRMKAIKDSSASRTQVEKHLKAQNFDLGVYKKLIEESQSLKLKIELINKKLNY